MATETQPTSADHGSEQPEAEMLMQRPVISIRARVAGVFIVLFALLAIQTVLAVIAIFKLTEKQHFLEKAEDYLTEIQEARRYEKNFLLYGTHLGEAVATIHTASNRLERAAKELQTVVGQRKYDAMKAVLNGYQVQLEEMLLVTDPQSGRNGSERRRIEVRLRQYGGQILVDAEDMIKQERGATHSMLQGIVALAIGFLLFMVFFLLYVANLIMRSVLRPLGRFVRYTSRIGGGDYSPIMPARKYRDEFSNLALAFNQMLQELTSRQEQLVQTRKMAAVGTLTSGIAHELNNPLNNIAITTEALIEGMNEYSEDEKLRMLDQISTQVERANSTVRNLLDFTRREQPAFTSVSIRRIVNSTLRLVGTELNLGHTDIVLDLDDGLPEVMGNPRNLEQVFLNLILNGIQAMPQGGTLAIRAGVENGCVRVDVSDDGAGIPAEILEKVFDPFFTTKDPGQGTGLGLSVSYSIVEKHGGRILVHSNTGKGTTFSVFLPCKEAEASTLAVRGFSPSARTKNATSGETP